MNILYITPYLFLPKNGGGKVAMYHQIKNFAEQENITVAAIKGIAAAPALNCEIVHFFSPSRLRYSNPIYVFKLKRLIAEKKIDFIILEHPYMGWMLVLLQLFTKIPFAIRSQNVEYLRFKDLGKWWHPILQRYEKWIHNKAKFVLCITEEDKAFFEHQGITSTLLNLPFGTDETANPTNKNICRENVGKMHQLTSDTKIILYNGSLSYLPNKIGLDIILEKINPILITKNINYKIIICGGGLDVNYKNLEAFADKNIIYAGFVDDISEYFKAADVFINPVQGGGGIKTKLIDALAYGATSISSSNGANGVAYHTVKNKLHITPDYDANAMANKIIEILSTSNNMPTPTSFYNYYNWKNCIATILAQIKTSPA